MRSALILAGGRSTRFGSEDKALAEIDGVPMIRRVADRAAAVADEVVINCREGQVAPVREALADLDALDGTLRFAVDPVPDEGPVAGMRTGLRAARGEHAAVLACDAPNADPSLLDSLCDRLTEAPTGAATAALPRFEGRLQPLHAVYARSETRIACDRTLATGSRRLLDAVERLDATVVDVAPNSRAAAAFANVNTCSDLASLGG